MNILVATDGTLDSKLAAKAVGRHYERGDRVFVFTAVNLPTDVLKKIGDTGVKAASQIALEAGQTLGAGDRAAERLMKLPHTSPPPKSDSPILHALATTANARMEPMIDALEKAGVEVGSFWRTTNNRTAQTILSAMRECETDLLVIGSHGLGKYEGMLGSTGTKLVRQSPASVLILRSKASPGQKKKKKKRAEK